MGFLTPEKCRIPDEQLEFAIKKAIANFETLPKDKKYVLSFSCGKDSIVMLDIILRNNIKLDFDIWHYFEIDFSADREIIEWFEKTYKVKIHERESANLERAIRNHMFGIGGPDNLSQRENKNKKGLEMDEELTFASGKYAYNLIGSRVSDSLTRRMNIKVSGWFQKRKIYPIYHFSEKEIWAYIYKFGIPVNKFYYFDRRSFEKFDYSTLMNVKIGFPEDFKKIVEKNPLVPTLFWIKERKLNNLSEFYQIDDFAKKANKKVYGDDLDRYIIFAFDEVEKKWEWCKRAGADEDLFYVNFGDDLYFGEKSIEIRKIPLGTVAKKTFDDEGGGATTAEKKKIEHSNIVDNFVAVEFETNEKKRKFLKKNNIPENIDVIDGEIYTLYDPYEDME